jgi:hypothetical protein
VDGSQLARTFFTSQVWSVRPCVWPSSAVHTSADERQPSASLKGAKPRHQTKERIGRGLRNALINAGLHGPIQEVERQKLEHGNNKRSDGFPKIMLVQADTSVENLYDTRQRAQDL